MRCGWTRCSSAPVLETLVGLDLIGCLEEEGAQRLVLLGDPAETPAAPIDRRLAAGAAGRA